MSLLVGTAVRLATFNIHIAQQRTRFSTSCAQARLDAAKVQPSRLGHQRDNQVTTNIYFAFTTVTRFASTEHHVYYVLNEVSTLRQLGCTRITCVNLRVVGTTSPILSLELLDDPESDTDEEEVEVWRRCLLISFSVDRRGMIRVNEYVVVAACVCRYSYVVGNLLYSREKRAQILVVMIRPFARLNSSFWQQKVG